MPPGPRSRLAETCRRPAGRIRALPRGRPRCGRSKPPGRKPAPPAAMRRRVPAISGNPAKQAHQAARSPSQAQPPQPAACPASKRNRPTRPQSEPPMKRLRPARRIARRPPCNGRAARRRRRANEPQASSRHHAPVDAAWHAAGRPQISGRALPGRWMAAMPSPRPVSPSREAARHQISGVALPRRWRWPRCPRRDRSARARR